MADDAATHTHTQRLMLIVAQELYWMVVPHQPLSPSRGVTQHRKSHSHQINITCILETCDMVLVRTEMKYPFVLCAAFVPKYGWPINGN